MDELTSGRSHWRQIQTVLTVGVISKTSVEGTSRIVVQNGHCQIRLIQCAMFPIILVVDGVDGDFFYCKAWREVWKLRLLSVISVIMVYLQELDLEQCPSVW